MSKLILVRHGETEKNTRDVLHDNFDSESLNAKGIEQVVKTAQYLKKYNPDIIITSKEIRAIETGKIISKEVNIPIKSVERLHERNWGVLSGKSWKEIQSVLDPMSFEERFNYVPEQGESWKSFENRLIETVMEIVRVNFKKNIVLVTHGGAIRALMPFLLNVSKEESYKYDPENASITVFDIISPREFKAEVVNNITHLA